MPSPSRSQRHLTLLPSLPPEPVEPQFHWADLDWWAVAGVLLFLVLPALGVIIGGLAS